MNEETLDIYICAESCFSSAILLGYSLISVKLPKQAFGAIPNQQRRRARDTFDDVFSKSGIVQCFPITVLLSAFGPVRKVLNGALKEGVEVSTTVFGIEAEPKHG